MDKLYTLSCSIDNTPSPSLQTETLLAEFIHSFASLPSNEFTNEINTPIMEFILSQLTSQSLSPQGQRDAITALKLLSRTRKGMEPIFKAENCKFLLQTCLSYLHKSEEETAQDCLKIVVNSVVVHQSETLATLHSIKAHEYAVQLFTETKDYSFLFVISRILFYTCLEKQTVVSLIEEHSFFDSLFSRFMAATSPGFQLDPITCRFVSECLKVLFMLNSEKPFSSCEKSENSETLKKWDKKEITERFGEIMKLQLSEEVLNTRDLGTPLSPGLYPVKMDLVNLMWTENTSPPPSFSEDPEILQGFLQLLTVQSQTERESAESALSALLFVLRGLCCTNHFACKFFKESLFGVYAYASGEEDGVEIDENTASEKAMRPAGFEDDAKDSLKTLLCAHLTSFQMTLKSAAGEFFYALAGEDASEYVRLVGFGNAAGLLAEKGLPGFEGMKKQALNLGNF